MRIFVFGNINAGKSYVVKHLTNLFKNYSVMKIDDYRIKNSDGTVKGEQLAQYKFVDTVVNTDNAIIEATGIGPLGKKLADSIPHRNSIILKVNSPLDLCIKRLSSKDFSKIPYPEVPETLNETITRCHYEFKKNCLENLWNYKVIDVINIDNQKDIAEQLNNIPFYHYQQFSKLIDLLINDHKIESIISYGSLGRGELSNLSDIDFYIVTKLEVNKVLDLIKCSEKDIWFSEIIGDKITLRYREYNLLIEIIVLKHLSEGERYYVGSRIDDKKKTIYKISEDDLVYLDSIDYKTTIDNRYNIDYLVREIIYFLLSLDNIIKKRDWYKYYFHNNIIIHNYIRIKALINDVEEYNYLPKGALSYITETELQQIAYSIGNDDALKHKTQLSEMIKKLFNDIDFKFETKYVKQYKYIIN